MNTIDRLFSDFDEAESRAAICSARSASRRSRSRPSLAQEHDGPRTRPRQSCAGRHDSRGRAVRCDRMEDRLARPHHLSVHGLQEGRAILFCRDGLEGAQRRRQAIVMDMGDVGEHHDERLCAAAGAAAPPPSRRRHRRGAAAEAAAVATRPPRNGRDHELLRGASSRGTRTRSRPS